ncbi:MAG TPA: hypothetical protein VIU38_00565 [Anaerolineales bacterium]
MGHKASFMLFAAVLLVGLTALAGCAPGTFVLGNTPAPAAQAATPAATPAPGGQINVPGVSIQVYAPGPNPLVDTAAAHGRPAGFWMGVWHGVISPVTLLIGFINKQPVQMYEVHNDGSLYNLGFFFGILIVPAVIGLLLGRRG